VIVGCKNMPDCVCDIAAATNPTIVAMQHAINKGSLIDLRS
jgi:hypothetical protein